MPLAPKDAAPYPGPGLWEGCAILPAVALVSIAAAIALALVAGPIDVVRAVVAGIVAGSTAWLVLWEVFARAHPRFSERRAAKVKVLAIFLGPPLVALVAAVTLR